MRFCAVCNTLSKPVNFMVGIKGKSFSVAELAHVGVRRIGRLMRVFEGRLFWSFAVMWPRVVSSTAASNASTQMLVAARSNGCRPSAARNSAEPIPSWGIPERNLSSLSR